MKLNLALGWFAATNLLLGLLIQWYVATRLGVGVSTDALFAGMAVLQLGLAVVSVALMNVLVPFLASRSFEPGLWVIPLGAQHLALCRMKSRTRSPKALSR